MKTPPYEAHATRRQFLGQLTAVGVLATLPAASALSATLVRKMRIALTPGSIGVRANQTEAIALAAKYGFEAVEPNAGYLAGLSEDALKALLDDLKAKNLTWAAGGFPLNFRGDDAAFQNSLKELPKTAAALKRAGVERVGTWLTPASDSVEREANMKLHADRLRAGAAILRDHGLRLGLEYVGTRTSRAGRKFPFVHNLAGTRELIRLIGQDNVGVVMDSWHWWQAGDTVADILNLKAAEVVAADLNDAPAGVAIDQQQDGKRELPMATGVIDVDAFLNALNQIRFDGPVRAEPFNKALNDLENDPACEAVSKAMRKAFALVK